MTTELQESITTTAPATPATPRTFNEAEVEEMVKRRRERDAENLRVQAENLRVQAEENKQLKARLEELERKQQKGTATTAEMQQLDTAKQAATQGQMQGYTAEQVQAHVQMAMEQKQLEDKLQDAYKKDPEFAKLVDENKKTQAVSAEEVLATAYLPNAPAVIKHLLKDNKSLALYKTALSRANIDGGVNAMMVLNNLSDRISDGQETAKPSDYTPAPKLSDASDNDQDIDVEDYISNKY